MRRRMMMCFALGLASLTIVVGSLTLLQPAVAGASTCTTKHCPANTHCCTGCTGSPICVKNGVPCPECAPQ